LWSADVPKASNSGAEAAPILYDIELPAPEEVGPAARFHAAMCARSLEDATQEVGKASLVAGLSRQHKACLALQLQLLCLVMVRDELPAAQREARTGMNALIEATSRAMDAACMGVAYGKGAMGKTFNLVGEHWTFQPSTKKWWRPQ
jgi:hypothetical protein